MKTKRYINSLKRFIHDDLHWLPAMAAGAVVASCSIEPPLHTVDPAIDIDPPTLEIELEAMWNYLFEYGVEYDWRAEWIYGWDETDLQIFGKLGYTEPEKYHLRRYYNKENPDAPHTAPLRDVLAKNGTLTTKVDFGYWDFLSWNDIYTPDGVQSIRIDETTTYDYVTATTGQTMMPTRYVSPYTHSFYQPEELFAAYQKGLDINRNLEGFVFDPQRGKWVRKLDMKLEPVTYIYLPQIILRNNNRTGRIVTAIDGDCNLSMMARSVTLNTGITGSDPITVNYSTRMKFDVKDREGRYCDVIGGKLLTFGITNLNPNKVPTRAPEESYKQVMQADKGNRHYIDIKMVFNNGMDSTFVFDVTDKVRRLFKGGVITIELDMDTIPVPGRKGGSGFDAVVKDYEEEEWEFDM